MTAEEWEVALTPLCCFDVQAPRRRPRRRLLPRKAVDPAAARFVTEVLEKNRSSCSRSRCEFWSVRKLFTKLGIAYRSVDVDSVEFQKEDLGGRIRGVLADRTGAKTLPQVFVGGEHIGGATDTFDAWRNGTLQTRLDQKGVRYDREAKLDPYSLLPKWLQPRKQA
jgi:cysteine synthase A